MAAAMKTAVTMTQSKYSSDILYKKTFLFPFHDMVPFPFALFRLHSSDYVKPRFATFLKYGKTELAPPTPGELVQGFGALGKMAQNGLTMQWRHLTVRVSLLWSTRENSRSDIA